MTFAYTITPNTISIFLDNYPRVIHRNAINFTRVEATLRQLGKITPNDTDYKNWLTHLRELLDIPSFIAKVTAGRVSVGDAGVMFDGKQVHGVIAKRLVDMLQQGLDIVPLARFLDRLYDNPDINAIDEMYLFLESGSLPLTPDGCFLAYKKVCSDYSSSHRAPDGSVVYNRIGTTVAMDRKEVNKNRDETCAEGLHFCSWQYLPSFGVGGESKVVVLKIAPENVVSIPSDYNNSKGRAWRYDVIAEVPESECKHLFDNKPVVCAFGIYDDTLEEDDTCLEEDPFPDEDPYLDDDESMTYDSDDDEALPVERGVAVFTHGKYAYSPSALKDAVHMYGQRGLARATGIPRTTIQEWLKRC